MVSLSSISSWFQRALAAFALGQRPARHAKPRTDCTDQEHEWCEHLWLLPVLSADESDRGGCVSPLLIYCPFCDLPIRPMPTALPDEFGL